MAQIANKLESLQAGQPESPRAIPKLLSFETDALWPRAWARNERECETPLCRIPTRSESGVCAVCTVLQRAAEGLGVRDLGLDKPLTTKPQYHRKRILDAEGAAV